ncbi:MAG: UDP-N-acetylmuramoyl-tripeptide--D-alanyl-D-alanine ligase [Acinetobacter sp.]|nr:UDP-N-acetylmuramoyl-tripeptide--D-alanyl-D-alanine ligase [Acinetobacter sp.]
MHTSTTSTTPLDPWSSQHLQHASQGQWYQQYAPQQAIQRIVTDSRQAQAGDAFLALKGERFDAHDFVANVAAQGASCVIVERAIDGINIPQLIVDDTRLALGRLGAYRRQECQQLQVVALTGSSGKTTTKEMLGSIFAQLGETLITRGNLNNDLGVPMMLLELRQDYRYAVFELGANHQGEIDYTANLVQPDVAGVINIGTAHLGEFGGREGICRAKSEIYTHLTADDTAIIPHADEFAATLAQAAQASSAKCLSFGQGGDVYAENIELFAQSSRFDLHTPQGVVAIELPFAGEHNVHNAEAAASFALALGLSLEQIQTGLAHAKGAKGRLNFIQKNHYTLIDDTYNANPTSMRAAADVLCQQDGVKIMVIGDIGELGDEAEAEHFALGRDLVQKPLDYLISVGEFAHITQQGANVAHSFAFSDQATALAHLQQIIQPLQQKQQRICFLFKGSRYTHMEHMLEQLLETL